MSKPLLLGLLLALGCLEPVELATATPCSGYADCPVLECWCASGYSMSMQTCGEDGTCATCDDACASAGGAIPNEPGCLDAPSAFPGLRTGRSALGSSCRGSDDCESALCLDVGEGKDGHFCSAECTADADCAGLACKSTRVLNREVWLCTPAGETWCTVGGTERCRCLDGATVIGCVVPTSLCGVCEDQCASHGGEVANDPDCLTYSAIWGEGEAPLGSTCSSAGEGCASGLACADLDDPFYPGRGFCTRECGGDAECGTARCQSFTGVDGAVHAACLDAGRTWCNER